MTNDEYQLPPPWDGSEDLDLYRLRTARYIKIQAAQRSPLLKAKDASGHHLYRMTENGSLRRTFPLSKSRRARVVERDGAACVQCGSKTRLEVDHIVRYVDGGGNELENLRTLCHACHGRRGGRA